MVYDVIPDKMIEELTKTEEAIEFHDEHKQLVKDILNESSDEPLAYISQKELPTHKGKSDPMFSSTMLDSNDESFFNCDEKGEFIF